MHNAAVTDSHSPIHPVKGMPKFTRVLIISCLFVSMSN